MAKICFKGKLYPEAFQVDMTTPQMTFNSPAQGVKMQIEIAIVKSVISINCEVDDYKYSDLAYYYIRAFDVARAAVNIIAFAKGIGFTVIIDTFINENGQSSMFAHIDKKFESICTAFDLNSATGFDEAFKIIGTDPSIFMALDDLIVSISTPHHSSVNCARAIEGIRQMIKPDKSGKPEWDEMHKVLNTTKSYVRLITDSSKSPRHGNRIRIEGDVTTEVTKRSWIIMNRFLEYRKRGNKPLPIADFPTLTS